MMTKLRPFTTQHLPALMQWFPDSASIAIWGDPHFRHPFTQQSFIEDLNLSNAQAFVLTNESNELLAFGQFYLRQQRCHLGRLVVSPLQRGKGLGKTLINELCTLGRRELNLQECSLFVMQHNLQAKVLYTTLGFNICTYPEPIPDDMIYMVKS